MSLSACVERLRGADSTLNRIDLSTMQYTDAELAELVDCLLTGADTVVFIWLNNNQLTDETGVKLARYLAASSQLSSLNLGNNPLGDASYLALAAAIRVNTSLRYLHMDSSRRVDSGRIDAAFVDALRLNPRRPLRSDWQLYASAFVDVDFQRLQAVANRMGHPTMLALLVEKL